MTRKNNWHKGEFIPKHPEKYIGTYPIIFRSSWENAFMQKCDNHPSIQKWASESIKIPYYNPLTQKPTIYIPDFLIQYVDRTGKIVVELLEIKPNNQANENYAKSRNNKIALALNRIKWTAATAWARKQGMKFRVMTETDMFMQKAKPTRKVK